MPRSAIGNLTCTNLPFSRGCAAVPCTRANGERERAKLEALTSCRRSGGGGSGGGGGGSSGSPHPLLRCSRPYEHVRPVGNGCTDRVSLGQSLLLRPLVRARPRLQVALVDVELVVGLSLVVRVDEKLLGVQRQAGTGGRKTAVIITLETITNEREGYSLQQQGGRQSGRGSTRVLRLARPKSVASKSELFCSV